ncbi:MAG: hypothetical protein ABL921_18025, partial [Pirellula sp.]
SAILDSCERPTFGMEQASVQPRINTQHGFARTFRWWLGSISAQILLMTLSRSPVYGTAFSIWNSQGVPGQG